MSSCNYTEIMSLEWKQAKQAGLEIYCIIAKVYLI